MKDSKELHSRVEAIEKRLDDHIEAGIDVWKGLERLKNDITWIKRSLWALVTIGIAVCGFLVKYVLFRLPIQP